MPELPAGFDTHRSLLIVQLKCTGTICVSTFLRNKEGKASLVRSLSDRQTGEENGKGNLQDDRQYKTQLSGNLGDKIIKP